MSVVDDLGTIRASSVGLDARAAIHDLIEAINDSSEETHYDDIYAIFDGTLTGEITIPSKNDVTGEYLTKVITGAYSNTDITSVIFENDSQIDTIEDYAFYHCESLEAFDFTGIKTVGIGAFRFCSSLGMSLVLPETIESLGSYVFANCSALKVLDLSNCVNLSDIPNGMCRSSGARTVTLPPGIESIGEYAFSDCSSILNIIESGQTKYGYFPSVTDLGVSAFLNCSALAKPLEFPEITSIPNSLCRRCSSLAGFTYDRSKVTEIGNMAFSGCSSMTTFLLPSNTEFDTIPNECFSGCTGLRSVNVYSLATFPRVIGEAAFLDCESLVQVGTSGSTGLNINVPRLKEIGERAFEGCSTLSAITLANSHLPSESLIFGERAFRECSGLTNVSLPKNLEYIPKDCFVLCSSLTTVNLSSLDQAYAPNFYIGESAFSYCTSLTTFNIGTGVVIKEIRDDAFGRCSALTSFDIPDGVERIGLRAFSGCTGLTSVTIPASVTEIGSSAFSGVPSTCTITCDFSQDSQAAMFAPWGSSARIVYQS